MFYLVGAVGLVAGNVISAGFMQAYRPPAMRGRVSTGMQFVNFGAIPLGAVLGGVLADGAGFRPALWILFSGFIAFSMVLFAAPIRGQRDLPTHAPEAS
jgi:uncharacterized membrane protein YgdD (TMEM256/DUF423 family)